MRKLCVPDSGIRIGSRGLQPSPMLGRHLDVFIGPSPDRGLLLATQGTDNPARNPHHKRTRRNLHPFWNQASSPYDAPRTYARTVHHDGTHADENFVVDPTRVKQCAMTNGDKTTDRGPEITRQMDDGAVLNIATRTDENALDVGPENALVPDTGMFPDFHISNHNSTWGNESTGVNVRQDFEMRANSFWIHVRGFSSGKMDFYLCPIP